MKKFNYRLEPILQIKTNFQDQALIELGKVNAECERLKIIIEDINCKNKSLKLKKVEFDFFEAQSIDLYRLKLIKDREKFLSELDYYEEKRKKALEKYVQAKIDTDIYVKLKEKQYKAYKKDIEKKYIKEIDDITNMRQIYLKSC